MLRKGTVKICRFLPLTSTLAQLFLLIPNKSVEALWIGALLPLSFLRNWPSLSCASFAAPTASSSSTMLTWPCLAPKCKQVLPAAVRSTGGYWACCSLSNLLVQETVETCLDFRSLWCGRAGRKAHQLLQLYPI